ncbi:MAG TPA: hypothetical protein VGL78_05820 [Solirubrobacteraceae bacterium]
MAIDPAENVAHSLRDRAPVLQQLRLAVVGAFILGLFVQFYLAARGAFGASSYSARRTFGDVLHFVTPVVLVLTLLSPGDAEPGRHRARDPARSAV